MQILGRAYSAALRKGGHCQSQIPRSLSSKCGPVT